MQVNVIEGKVWATPTAPASIPPRDKYLGRSSRFVARQEERVMSMRAIQFREGGGPASECLELVSIPKPTPEPTDILVKLKAGAVNPVDIKIRQGKFPASQITGYDAAGIVESIGSSVATFRPGDEVYFSGTLGRPGSTAQYSLVDHSLAALKPRTLDWIESACAPLVTITAWELLEEHFGLVQDDPHGTQKDKSILIINGAGGVGSVATQLARRVFNVGRVIVTAGRPETREHVRSMGATHDISHRESLEQELQEKVGIQAVDYIFICYDTNAYMETVVKVAAPKAKIGSIVEISDRLDGMQDPMAFMKQLSFHWELMLSKGKLGYELASQGDILARAAKLYDAGVLTCPVSERGVLSVATLIKMHEMLEGGKTIGKIGFEIGDDILKI